MAYRRLGELLLASGMITEEELNRGLELQKGTNDRLGTVLIKNGIISEDNFIEALQMQLGIEFVDLTKVNIPTELAQVVPKSIAKQYQVVPVRVFRDELYLAMSDPMNFYAIEEVRKASRKKVVPMIATRNAVEHSIRFLYGNEGAAKAIEEMKRESGASAAAAGDNNFNATQIGIDDVDSAPTIRLVNSMIERGITERASDIHMEPRENEYLVRMRIDGIMREVLNIPKDLQASVISRVKIMSGLDISEHRVPQDGRFSARVQGKEVDLRVSTLPTIYGEKIVCRLLDKTAGRVSTESLGLSDKDLAMYRKLLSYRNGVVLLVGPTGSGKTTTMYAMIGELNRPEVNLVTLEDPVEYNLNGVNQVQINEKTGMTFAVGLRAILRQDPDIVAIGEIRDGETAEIAMRAALTGRFVLSTIHTNDAVGSIDRLINIGVEPYMVSSALRGVISQRLVRRICSNCKEAYAPSEEEQESLGVREAPGTLYYRGAGCPDCFHTGYRGRVAGFEFMPVTKKVRDLIVREHDRESIKSELQSREEGFVSMRDSLMNLVREGITTTEEVLRVTNEET